MEISEIVTIYLKKLNKFWNCSYGGFLDNWSKYGWVLISDCYSVIGRWTESDGTEEWDVIHNGPLTYEEALEIATKASRTWDENVPSDRKNLPHKEIPIKYETLQEMLTKIN
jgi:hypothetical protein